MNVVLRRLATLLLLLAVPLRVYAAAAMMFCGQPGEVSPETHVAPDVVQVESALTLQAPMPAHADDADDAVAAQHGGHHEVQDAGFGQAQPHGSCAACCCAGMIATAHYDWKPQSFSTPATPDFVAIAVPPTVPHRLERPPRSLGV